MGTATGKISGAAVLEIGEDSLAANSQTYGLPREMVIECETNTVLQLRLDLEDYSGGDVPVLGIALGYASGTFTVNTGTEVLTTSVAHGRAVGDEVVLTTTTTLPAPLTGDVYYVESIPSATELKLAATNGGSAINITTTGTGTHSFAAYGTTGGVQITEDAYVGPGYMAAPAITLKDQRSGTRDSFEQIKALQVVICPTDGTADASGQIWLEGGADGDPDSYFRFSLKIDAAADSGHSSFAVFALPEGWNYQDANKITLNIIASSNLTVLMNFLGK